MEGIGIDIGGTNTKIVVVGDGKKVIKEKRFCTEPERGPADFMRRLSEAVGETAADRNYEVKALGVGMAGDIDPDKGILRFSPNLNWQNVKIAGPLAALTGLPCAVENDANMAAWGAYADALDCKEENVVVLTLGTGIGSGLIINGRLYHGATGSAGEGGHINIVPDGLPCNCGSRGCLEAYCGSIGIMRRAEKLIGGKEDFVKKYSEKGKFDTLCLSRAASAGNAAAVKIFEETGHYLGLGIVELLIMFNPSSVILTGGVSRAGKWFMPEVLKVIERRKEISPFVRTPFSSVRIVIADNPEMGSKGAALWGLRAAGLI